MMMLWLMALLSETKARRTLHPFDLPQFQPVLQECRLQCPSTRRSIRELANLTIPDHFYVKRSSSTDGKRGWTALYDMAISMDMRIGERCELRHNQEWSTTSVAQRFSATLKVIPANPASFTIMQIHSVDFTGTDGIDYDKGPLLMLGRYTKEGITEHLWAKVRTSMSPKRGKPFDLGPRPIDFFDLDVVVENSVLRIFVDGHLKLEQNVQEWDVLRRNVFKTGTYVHGSGPHRVEYKELQMGPTKPLTVNETPSAGPRVLKIVVVDAKENKDLFDLENGQVLDLDSLADISLRVDVTEPQNVGSVAFKLDGQVVRVENKAPYAIAGDFPQGNFNPWKVEPGTHVVSVSSYSSRGAKGDEGDALTVSFEAVNLISLMQATAAPTLTPTIQPTVTPPSKSPTESPTLFLRTVEMVLIDVESGKSLDTLTDGFVVNTTIVPKFTVRANTRPKRVGSVLFAVNDDAAYRRENIYPYTIAGDNRGVSYKPWRAEPGEYTITATPYPESNHRGLKGEPLSIWITIV